MEVNRDNGASDRSVGQPPLHRHQAKTSGVAPNNSERFKTKEESPDRSKPVPKFGDWDETDPASADAYTGIFDVLREEKQTGSAKVPQTTDDSKYLNLSGRAHKSSCCSCFSWCKK